MILMYSHESQKWLIEVVLKVGFQAAASASLGT